MLWRIWKNKPWRDPWWYWRVRSPEFPEPFNSFSEARKVRASRKDDGARTIIMPSLM